MNHHLIKFLTIFIAITFLAGCTYENQISGGATDYKKVISPDGRKAVFIRHLLTYRHATGIAAFPDGGIPKIEEDKVFLYISNPDGTNEKLITELKAKRASDVIDQIRPWDVKLNWQDKDRIKYIIIRRYTEKISKKSEGIVEIPPEFLE